jgi:hypothetical protein
VEKHGEDAVRAGRYPRRRTPRQTAPLEAQLDAEYVSNGSGAVTPAAVRPALAQAAADELGTITAVLMDAATNTTRPVWTTPACPECGTQFRQEVHVPDHKARVAAVEVLLREGLGRPAQAEEPTTPRLPDSVDAVQRMSWEDMQYVFAMTHVDEIEAALRDGAEEALRARLADITASDRERLTQALADLGVA